MPTKRDPACPVRGCRFSYDAEHQVMCCFCWIRMGNRNREVHERLLTAIAYAKHNPDRPELRAELEAALAAAVELLETPA
jgi:hypothetical protein